MTPWTVARQGPLSMGFPTQEYWSGLPFPPPGDFPDQRIEPRSSASPALQEGSSSLRHWRDPFHLINLHKFCSWLRFQPSCKRWYRREIWARPQNLSLPLLIYILYPQKVVKLALKYLYPAVCSLQPGHAISKLLKIMFSTLSTVSIFWAMCYSPVISYPFPQSILGL